MKAKNENSLSVRTYAREGKETREEVAKSRRVLRESREVFGNTSARSGRCARRCFLPSEFLPLRRVEAVRHRRPVSRPGVKAIFCCGEAMRSQKMNAPPLVFVGWRFGTAS